MNFLHAIERISPAPWERVAARLGAEDLSLAEAAALLTADAGTHLEEMAQAAHALTRRRFGRTIKLYAPIYLSNECINGCLYCGFRHGGTIARRTLAEEEAIAEARVLTVSGHRHLLLVAGEHPQALPLAKLAAIAHAIRPKAAGLAIEVQPFDEAGYRTLADAGVDGVTLYQESYDAEAYQRFHPSGPKKHYGSRVEAIDAAGRAGMRFLGIGALLGLADWRREALSIVAHARHLMHTHWRSAITVSLPRIRDCSAAFAPPHPVSDRELAQMIMALRLSLPDAGIVLSTREPAALRDRLLPLGITQMSAGSATAPGGYTMEGSAGAQFHLEDGRTPAEVAAMLARAGYDPVWKDWDEHLHG